MIYITRARPRCVAPRAPLKKYNNDLIFCERTLIHSLFLSPSLFCSFLSFFALYLFVSIYLSLNSQTLECCLTVSRVLRALRRGYYSPYACITALLLDHRVPL